MRIAQVAPLTYPVPPLGFGGSERIVSYLTEALVQDGHEVTLFARAESQTQARLIAPAHPPMGSGRLPDVWAYYHLLLEQVYRHTGAFDIVHFHLGYRHFPVLRRQPLPHVTSTRWGLELDALVYLFNEYREMPLISLSDNQREPVPEANWVATIYNGLPVGLYQAVETPGRSLVFLGRISPVKGVAEAIEIARRAALPLKIAGYIEDRSYFEARVRPHLSDPLIEYVGEVGDREKQDLLGQAVALLFPIRWREPFGIVMIEAMACGTPVVAFRRGSVPEVIDEGVTGFVVDDVDGAVQALEGVGGLSCRRCREVFEARFSARRVMQEHLAVYERFAS